MKIRLKTLLVLVGCVALVFGVMRSCVDRVLPARSCVDLVFRGGLDYLKDPSESFLWEGQRVVVFGYEEAGVEVVSRKGRKILLTLGTRCVVLREYVGDQDDAYGNPDRPLEVVVSDGEYRGEAVEILRWHLRRN